MPNSRSVKASLVLILCLLLQLCVAAQEVEELPPREGQIFPRFRAQGQPPRLTREAALADLSTHFEAGWLEARLSHYPLSRTLLLALAGRYQEQGRLQAAALLALEAKDLPDREPCLLVAELLLQGGHAGSAHELIRRAGPEDLARLWPVLSGRSPFRELAQAGWSWELEKLQLSGLETPQGRSLRLGGRPAYYEPLERRLHLPDHELTLTAIDDLTLERLFRAYAEDGAIGEELGRSNEGRRLFFYRLGEGPETIWLLSAFHGDEPESEEVLKRFWQELLTQQERLRGKRLIVMTAVNPDGLAKGERVNARGVDLNRNFPAKNWTSDHPGTRYWGGPGPASEPETQALLELFERFRPHRIVSIHTPLHNVNYDGPARDLAEEMAGHNGYPVEADIGYPTPGSFGTYLGRERQIPVITLELREAPLEKLWEENREALWAAVEFRSAKPSR